MASLVKWGAERHSAATPGKLDDYGPIAALPDGGLAAVAFIQTPGVGTTGFALRSLDGLNLAVRSSGTYDLSATGITSLTAITALADGHILVAWTSAYQPASGRSSWAQEFGADCQAVGGPVQISAPGLSTILDSVAALQDGSYVAAWQQYDRTAASTSNDYNVYARFYAADGTPGAAFRLNQANNGAEGAAQLAIRLDGGLNAIWIKHTGLEKLLISRSFDADGAPLTGERVVARVSGSLNDPGLTVLSNGSVAVQWSTWDFSSPTAFPPQEAHFVLFNSTLTERLYSFTPETISDGLAPDGNAQAPQVLELNDGRVLLAWGEVDFDGIAGFVTLKAVIVTPSGSASEVLILAPRHLSSAGDFGLTELADGRIVVNWFGIDDSWQPDTVTQIFDPREAGISLTATTAAVSWAGTQFADTLTGGAGHDRIFSADGTDRLVGGNGNDVLNGGAGNDLIFGGNGHDLVRGWSGADIINGGGGNDMVSGGGGNDAVAGNAGNDTVSGGGGNDTVAGNAGNDTLWGNSGADRFVLAQNGGQDQVMDFTDGLDQIDLRGFGFASEDAALAAFTTTSGGVLFAHGTTQALFIGLSLANIDAGDVLI